jgi:hypothetical protein
MHVVLTQVGLESVTFLLWNKNFMLSVYLKLVFGCVPFLYFDSKLGDLCLFL